MGLPDYPVQRRRQLGASQLQSPDTIPVKRLPGENLHETRAVEAGNALGERFFSFGLVFSAIIRRIKEPHGSCEPSERCQSGLIERSWKGRVGFTLPRVRIPPSPLVLGAIRIDRLDGGKYLDGILSICVQWLPQDAKDPGLAGRVGSFCEVLPTPALSSAMPVEEGSILALLFFASRQTIRGLRPPDVVTAASRGSAVRPQRSIVLEPVGPELMLYFPESGSQQPEQTRGAEFSRMQGPQMRQRVTGRTQSSINDDPVGKSEQAPRQWYGVPDNQVQPSASDGVEDASV